jgi:hypothetical protein
VRKLGEQQMKLLAEERSGDADDDYDSKRDKEESHQIVDIKVNLNYKSQQHAIFTMEVPCQLCFVSPITVTCSSFSPPLTISRSTLKDVSTNHFSSLSSHITFFTVCIKSGASVPISLHSASIACAVPQNVLQRYDVTVTPMIPDVMKSRSSDAADVSIVDPFFICVRLGSVNLEPSQTISLMYMMKILQKNGQGNENMRDISNVCSYVDSDEEAKGVDWRSPDSIMVHALFRSDIVFHYYDLLVREELERAKTIGGLLVDSMGGIPESKIHENSSSGDLCRVAEPSFRGGFQSHLPMRSNLISVSHRLGFSARMPKKMIFALGQGKQDDIAVIARPLASQSDFSSVATAVSVCHPSVVRVGQPFPFYITLAVSDTSVGVSSDRKHVLWVFIRLNLFFDPSLFSVVGKRTSSFHFPTDGRRRRMTVGVVPLVPALTLSAPYVCLDVAGVDEDNNSEPFTCPVPLVDEETPKSSVDGIGEGDGWQVSPSGGTILSIVSTKSGTLDMYANDG